MLDYVEVPTPQPKAGEVLVKADTIGVSRPELLVRRGVYAWMPPLPVIPGIEMAGTVAELGAGATRFAVGQKVYVTARELPVRAGCYAEYIAVPERALFALPRGRRSGGGGVPVELSGGLASHSHRDARRAGPEC